MSLFFCSLKGIDTQSGKYQKHLISARNHSASARSASERGGDAGAVASRCPIGLTLLAAAGLMLVVQPWSPDSTAVSKLLATAAGVLVGASANGRVAWKDKRGVTLKELQQCRVDETPRL